MTAIEKHIIKTYSQLFDGLSSKSKMELMVQLEKSLKKEKKEREEDFFKAFGSFGSEKSAEEIAKEIKESRKFRKREINFTDWWCSGFRRF